MHIAQTKRLGAEEGMKKLHEWKKAGMLTLAFLIIAGQSSCGTDKVQQTEEKVQEAAEAPAEEQEETQPEITPGEMQGLSREQRNRKIQNHREIRIIIRSRRLRRRYRMAQGTERFHLRQRLHQEACSEELRLQEQ